MPPSSAKNSWRSSRVSPPTSPPAAGSGAGGLARDAGAGGGAVDESLIRRRLRGWWTGRRGRAGQERAGRGSRPLAGVRVRSSSVRSAGGPCRGARSGRWRCDADPAIDARSSGIGVRFAGRYGIGSPNRPDRLPEDEFANGSTAGAASVGVERTAFGPGPIDRPAGGGRGRLRHAARDDHRRRTDGARDGRGAGGGRRAGAVVGPVRGERRGDRVLATIIPAARVRAAGLGRGDVGRCRGPGRCRAGGRRDPRAAPAAVSSNDCRRTCHRTRRS